MNKNDRTNLHNIKERLAKVVILAAPERMDILQSLVNDARWLVQQVEMAEAALIRMAPKDAA